MPQAQVLVLCGTPFGESAQLPSERFAASRDFKVVALASSFGIASDLLPSRQPVPSMVRNSPPTYAIIPRMPTPDRALLRAWLVRPPCRLAHAKASGLLKSHSMCLRKQWGHRREVFSRVRAVVMIPILCTWTLECLRFPPFRREASSLQGLHWVPAAVPWKAGSMPKGAVWFVSWVANTTVP